MKVNLSRSLVNTLKKIGKNGDSIEYIVSQLVIQVIKNLEKDQESIDVKTCLAILVDRVEKGSSLPLLEALGEIEIDKKYQIQLRLEPNESKFLENIQIEPTLDTVN